MKIELDLKLNGKPFNLKFRHPLSVFFEEDVWKKWKKDKYGKVPYFLSFLCFFLIGWMLLIIPLLENTVLLVAAFLMARKMLAMLLRRTIYSSRKHPPADDVS